MIQIRHNTWETNSSSTHALIIDLSNYWGNKDYLKEWREHARSFTITGGDYGRSPRKPLISLEEKVNYLWTAVVDTYYSFYPDYRVIEENKQIVNWWKEKILENCPKGCDFIELNEDNFPWIDHAAEIENFVKECEKDERLISCLLDDESFIEISGDEYPNLIYVALPKNQEQLIYLPNPRYAAYIKGN